jgi:hypothetical protein
MQSSSRPRLGATAIVLRALGAGVLGVVLAAIAEYLFFVSRGSWLNLVVWAVVGLVLGALSKRWPTAIWVDAVVGFAIVFTYSVLGYRGAAPLVGALAPFAAIALVGAVGMAAAGAAGFALRRLVTRGRRAA